MSKKFILFDIGYTLLYQDREKNYQNYLKQLGIDRSLDAIYKAYHISDKQFMREFKGVLGKEPASFLPWFLATVNFQLNVQVDLIKQFQALQQANDENAQFWHPFPFTQKTLQLLKSQGYRLGIISNWDETARPLLEQYDLARYFDPIVISSEFGKAKPSDEIFEHALALADVSAKDAIYVGDNYYDDVIGAAAIGLETVLINPYGRLGIEEIEYDLVIESIEYLPKFLNHGGVHYA